MSIAETNFDEKRELFGTNDLRTTQLSAKPVQKWVRFFQRKVRSFQLTRWERVVDELLCQIRSRTILLAHSQTHDPRPSSLLFVFASKLDANQGFGWHKNLPQVMVTILPVS